MKKGTLVITLAVLLVGAGFLFSGNLDLPDMFNEIESNNFEKYGPVGIARADYDIITENLPKFREIVINPLDVHVGDTQTFTVFFESSSEVIRVETVTELDNGVMNLPLEKIENSSGEIVFSGYWEVKDTHTKTYRTKFTAWDSKGNENSVYMTWTDPCTGIVHGSTSVLSVPCTVSSVDGSDSGNIVIEAGNTVTINTGGTFVWTPGYSITVNGSIAVGSGAVLQKGYLFYADSDGDGSGDGTLTWSSTPSSSGYVRPTEAVSSTDCDTGNAYIYQSVAGLSSDNDQDRYTDTGAATRCVGDSTVAANGQTYYKDSAGAYTWLTDSQKIGISDCNDGSATAWRNRYLDADSDAYCANSSLYCVGNDSGYRDSCTAYSDCSDGNASVYQNLTGYVDSDSDGYGAGTGQQVCSGASLPAGYSSNNTDCNNSNSYIYASVANLAIDLDRDRYYVGSFGTQCVGYQADYWFRALTGQHTWLHNNFDYGFDCNDSYSYITQNYTLGSSCGCNDCGSCGSVTDVCSGACSAYYSNPYSATSCNGPSNACGSYYTGTTNVCTGACSATTAPPTPYSATSCNGPSNACGSYYTGTTNVCTGNCSATTAPPTPYSPSSCNGPSNVCGSYYTGTTDVCSGDCSATTAPPTPYNPALFCNGPSNTCGDYYVGHPDACTGACSASTAPPNPYPSYTCWNSCGTDFNNSDVCNGGCTPPPNPYAVVSCNGPSNSCGMYNTGTTNACTGACSATTAPSESLCCTANGDPYIDACFNCCESAPDCCSGLGQNGVCVPWGTCQIDW